MRAIKTVFGEHAYKLAVSSTKSATGHLLGAAGGLETGILALAIHEGKLPPTINLDDPDDECDLDFVPHVARDIDLRIALTNSFGFGGTNGALVLKKTVGVAPQCSEDVGAQLLRLLRTGTLTYLTSLQTVLGQAWPPRRASSRSETPAA